MSEIRQLAGRLLDEEERIDSPKQGADTMVWLTAAPEPAKKSGELWFDREVVPKHFLDRTRETPEEREQLWERLVEITGCDLPDLSGVER